jgi:parallel beta-helix repeat protein
MSQLANRIRDRKWLYFAIAGILVIAAVVIGLNLQHNGTAADSHSSAGKPTRGDTGATGDNLRTGRTVCGQPILRSPFSYDSAPGSYSSGQPGLPTYGTPGSDFPDDRAGTILPTGTHYYASYQLSPNTVYYLLPGTHIGNLQADTNDAFVGGFSDGQATVLSGDYSQPNWAIDSNSSIGNQADVTVEYLIVEKYLPDGNSAAINPDSNTGWTIRYNTITLNVPGAGVILGSDNVLEDNCMTLNGQYGFQSVDANSWGQDSLTGGPYNVTVEGNEISYNDTCDFEGLLDNSSIGWSKRDPVPSRYRNSHCGPVVPDGDQGGFKLWQTDGVTIKDNYIHNNWGPGGWVDTDNANTTFTGNTITANDDEAIIEEISYNFSITDNYLADNGWAGGLADQNFPSAAIYISESGSDRTFGGVPGCPETSCSDQRSYSHESVISRNTMIDNSGGVFLWQDSNRFCTDGSDAVCTLVRSGSSGPFTLSGCKANLPSASIDKTSYVGNLTGSPRRDWWDGCLWKTENVSITHNMMDFNPANIPNCNRTDWLACGANGIFSEYGSVAPYSTPYILTQLMFFQNDSWSDNSYKGPSTFYAWNQGNGDNPVSWGNWTGSVSGGDKCSSPAEHQSGYCNGPFGEDTGSTYNPTPSS